MTTELQDALWAGDVDRLRQLAPCKCCCSDHTYRGCPARQWGGCRGQGSEEQDHRSWFQHYQKFHGMSQSEFYGLSDESAPPKKLWEGPAGVPRS
jgi:hypothetical protein